MRISDWSAYVCSSDLPAVVPVDPGLSAAIGAWRQWLRSEKRMSPHTLAAYGGDLGGFLAFLGRHLGETISLSGLAGLAPADFRAWLARRAHDGLAKS